MVVYNIYLVLNDDEPISIYDKHRGMVCFKGSAYEIPYALMDRLVHQVAVVQGKEKRYKRLLIVIG